MLVLESQLIPVTQLKAERIDAIRKAAKDRLLELAEAALGKDKRLIIRDLTPLDLEATNNEWVETSGTDNQWSDTTITGTLADNRFVVIIGVKIIDGHTTPPISALKFTVGGSEVARWDMYPAFKLYILTTSGAINHENPLCIAEAPIFISQNIPFTVAEYVLETTTAYVAALIGLVCEPEGKVLKG
ncbi:hypothetical protein ES703_120484 [subsurface metagenome]